MKNGVKTKCLSNVHCLCSLFCMTTWNKAKFKFSECYINCHHQTVITSLGAVFVSPVFEEGSVSDAALIGMAEGQMMDGWMERLTVSVSDSMAAICHCHGLFSVLCVCPHVCPHAYVLDLSLSRVFLHIRIYCMNTPAPTLYPTLKHTEAL